MQHNDLFMYYFPAVSHCIHTHIGLLNKSGEFKLEQSITLQRNWQRSMKWATILKERLYPLLRDIKHYFFSCNYGYPDSNPPNYSFCL